MYVNICFLSRNTLSLMFIMTVKKIGFILALLWTATFWLVKLAQ